MGGEGVEEGRKVDRESAFRQYAVDLSLLFCSRERRA